jgi:thiol-disulfide isomerase/thioredoxin
MMKKLLLSFTQLFFIVFGHTQTILVQPSIGMSTAPYIKIERIELRDTATVLWFHADFKAGNWIRIPKETYIQPVGSKERLSILAAEGIPLAEKFTIPASGEINYHLTFPKIDPTITKIDYGEANDGATWFFYDILLKPELFKSILPENLTGNWFRCDNAQWEISLFDSVAIYKSQVWKYVRYTDQKGTCKIMLKNGSKNLNLFIKRSENGNCLIGETPAKFVNCTHTPNETAIPTDNTTYNLPIFKMDTAIYCGYIKGFNPRFPKRTGLVAVNYVIEGKQNTMTFTISADGTFYVKIPHINPLTVYVRLPFSTQNIFIEPGKTTFHLIDNASKSNQNLFMGDNARLNSDLLKLKNFSSYNYDQMMNKVLDFSPEQYKAYIQDLQQKDLMSIDEIARKNSLSAKAVQIKKIELNLQYASYLMEYGMHVEGAYRTKNNIPPTQREIPIKPAKPDSSYYRFLTNDLVNNQLAVLVSDYFFFINRIMYLDILRPSLLKSYTIPELVLAIEKAGLKVTAEEKELAKQLDEAVTPEVKKLQNKYQEQYGDQSITFHTKYANKLQLLYKEKKGSTITPAMEEEYLIGQKIALTDQEKAMLIATYNYQSIPIIQEYTSLLMKYSKQSLQFRMDHREFISQLYTESSIASREEKLKKILGIQPGFATDIMASQDFCRPFAHEMTPLSDEKIKTFQQKITTPFIANYVKLVNNQAKEKVAANKFLKGSKANEVPKTEGNKIFDAIISKYKGKVIYVDFWATWCAPCRSGIERIKPLKDELAGENVVFIYITNQTSPKATYENMIPTIKGEHYRVSDDEWNILSGMFKISGIPHCVLVGKDGNVINPKLGYYENEELKSLLMKHIKG